MHTQLKLTGMVCLGLSKALSTQETFEMVLNPDRVGRFCRLAGNKFQTNGVMKQAECWPANFKSCLGIFNSLLLEDWRVHDVTYLHSEAEMNSYKALHLSCLHITSCLTCLCAFMLLVPFCRLSAFRDKEKYEQKLVALQSPPFFAYFLKSTASNSISNAALFCQITPLSWIT